MRNLLQNTDGKKTVLLGISLVIGALIAAAYLYFNVVVFERAPREQTARHGQSGDIDIAGQHAEQDMPLVNGVATKENNTPSISQPEPDLPDTYSSEAKGSKHKSANTKLPHPKDSRP